MRIEVTLFATLAEYAPAGAPQAGPAVVEVPEGGTVASLAEALEIPPDICYVAVVNGNDATLECRLSDGDSVVLFPPLMGGAR